MSGTFISSPEGIQVSATDKFYVIRRVKRPRGLEVGDEAAVDQLRGEYAGQRHVVGFAEWAAAGDLLRQSVDRAWVEVAACGDRGR